MKLTSVKLYRFQRHLLQMQVAKSAEIPWSRLAEIENGDAEPLPDELERIALALGVSTQELVGLRPS
jgi:transcriptional regulator with XRE-family HTH domain